ncbi:exported hypothetical protein [Burkholderiales bacterium]|nr:exported hypothetical protein [Burkholderiales bacterium]
MRACRVDAELASTPVARRPAGLLAAVAVTAGALALGWSAAAGADEPAGQVPAQYRLTTLTPAGAPAPTLPGVASLGAGQEFLFSLPASFRFDSLAGINFDDIGNPLDRPRATYRYTWFSRPSWDVKIGLSTSLDPGTPWQRFVAASSTDHLHVGSLPTMHLSGESRLADRWLFSVSAEGLWTGRGQGLDMDLRVDYSLTRDVALFGSYRLTDSIGEGPEVYGFVPSNSAQFGVRLRF